jgi:hypothetical protein
MSAAATREMTTAPAAVRQSSTAASHCQNKDDQTYIEFHESASLPAAIASMLYLRGYSMKPSVVIEFKPISV